MVPASDLPAMAQRIAGQVRGHPRPHEQNHDPVGAGVLDRVHSRIPLAGGMLGNSREPRSIQAPGLEAALDQVTMDHRPLIKVNSSWMSRYPNAGSRAWPSMAALAR